MGTFILKPTSVSNEVGAWESRIDGVSFPFPTNDELIGGATGDLPVSSHTYVNIQSTGSITFGVNGLGMYLDGSLIPIDTNNLPVDFTVIDCDLIASLEEIGSGTGVIEVLHDGSPVWTFPPDGGNCLFNLGPLTNLQLISAIIGFGATIGTSLEIRCGMLSITGTYTAEPTVITLDPSGGDVEPGQTIDVDGDPTDYTYAGTNDPKVIPIPKKPGDPPKLPVPLPPTEECSECLTACPECDNCYDACMEDLESENCQECLETCLECLVDCLEDEEEAEKCQQSQQDDPPTDIVIIVCDPRGTRFYGSVPAGTFTILVARASGIYRLVDGKTNDTQYATARDGTTYDVAIPTPFAKTGFFRS